MTTNPATAHLPRFALGRIARRLPQAIALAWLVFFAICTRGAQSGPEAAPGDSAPQPTAALRVMTFNVRYASSKPPNDWPARRSGVSELILAERPDLIGTQEGVIGQLRDMAEDLPDYAWIGEGRNGGHIGEFMAVFYRTERLALVEQGHFWLSDTPDVKGSKSWGNTLPRMATWARFRDLTNAAEFYLLNTHFDHQSQTSRERSADMVRARAKSMQQRLPVIVTGDFNAVQTSKVHETLTAMAVGKNPYIFDLKDVWEFAPIREGDGISTFHGWGEPDDKGRRIDWILTSPRWSVAGARVVQFRDGEQWPSDHFPVVADVILNDASATDRGAGD